METKGFQGLTVAAFESRLAEEMRGLITRYGGRPLVAPSMQEVPLEHNTEGLRAAEELLAGQTDLLILLTGVGTQAMVELLATRHAREDILKALRRTTIVARGPKPVAALRQHSLTAAITVPEPNTWRDILNALDQRYPRLQDLRIAVQEYGVPNEALLVALKQRGATVTRIPVYRWALPADIGPLQRVIDTIVHGQVDVVLVTNAAQVDHVMTVAAGKKIREALTRVVVASIGPTASERLKAHGWPVDLVPSHPKMGLLVKEASEQAAAVLQRKRR